MTAAPYDDATAAPYDDALDVREARNRYFAVTGLGEHSYEERWVVLYAGPVPLIFPNSAGRVRAVRLHDIHHVLTGYGTDWTGEGEIAAWEIASSCRHHWAAWALDLSAMGIALWLSPRRVWQAFRRGRLRRNLYVGEWEDALLEENLGALRNRLGIPAGGEVVDALSAERAAEITAGQGA